MDIRALDESYFLWLYSQVADPEIEEPYLTHWQLLRQLFTTKFVWRVHNDEARLQDGKALRLEFVRTEGLEGVEPEWMNIECSVLELMVGLARHMAFMVDGEPPFCFWKITENIGLRRYNDHVFNEDTITDVDVILDHLIERRYQRDGQGGFFPLRHPSTDQRGVELWYQMSAYVVEIDD
jgi:hypothetical protein